MVGEEVADVVVSIVIYNQLSGSRPKVVELTVETELVIRLLRL